MNKVVPKTEVLSTALAWAVEITTNSPDSVQSTKRALLLTNKHADVEDIVKAHARSKESVRHFTSENIKVGRHSRCVHCRRLTSSIRKDFELSRR